MLNQLSISGFVIKMQWIRNYLDTLGNEEEDRLAKDGCSWLNPSLTLESAYCRTALVFITKKKKTSPKTKAIELANFLAIHKHGWDRQ